jgi:hypothetical protein
MKHLRVVLLSVLVLFVTPVANALQTGDQPKPKMSDTEKVLTWKGERVYFLKPFQPDNTIYTWCEPEKRLPTGRYGGRTGVITAVTLFPERVVTPGKLNHGAYRLDVSFEDNGEAISICNVAAFVFLAGLEAGKRAAGEALWIKDREDILECSTVLNFSPAGIRGATKVSAVGYAGKLVFTSIELGNERDAYLFHVRTESGQEGCLDVEFWNGNYRMGLDERFHLEGSDGLMDRSFWDYFYSQDPHKLHPDWKPSIWQLIDQGKVAIGMTQQMAEYACGGGMEEAGVALDDSGGVATFYECHDRKFLVEKGKVTKYVE